MNFVKENIKSYQFILFCGTMFIGHELSIRGFDYCSKKKKLNLNINTRYFISYFFYTMVSSVYTVKNRINMIDTINNPLIVKFYNVLFFSIPYISFCILFDYRVE